MWFTKNADDLKFDFSDLEESIRKSIKRKGGRWTQKGTFVVTLTNDGTIKPYILSMQTDYIPIPPDWRED